jgi:hypothetical protein
MSARKLQSAATIQQQITVEARQTRLTLSPDSVKIHKSGIEFSSLTPFSLWTEMTLNLDSPLEGRVNCTGVVVACVGNRHSGYRVSMIFTGISKQSQARLNTLAYS